MAKEVSYGLAEMVVKTEDGEVVPIGELESVDITLEDPDRVLEDR